MISNYYNVLREMLTVIPMFLINEKYPILTGTLSTSPNHRSLHRTTLSSRVLW